jgi:hypothetical protein
MQFWLLFGSLTWPAGQVIGRDWNRDRSDGVAEGVDCATCAKFKRAAF